MPVNAHTVVAFAAIMGTIFAGISHWSWWAAVTGGCCLALVSLMANVGAFARYGHEGSAIALPTLLLSSALNSSAAASASFLLGRLIAWVWGL
jgi:hypothetical protein